MNPIDDRYGRAKDLIMSGRIQTFNDIFRVVPKTTVSKDAGMTFNRFSAAVRNPAKFRVAELFVLAELFGMGYRQFVAMAVEAAIVYKERNLTIPGERGRKVRKRGNKKPEVVGE